MLDEALKALDPANDDHWTSDGLPRVDVITGLVGQAVTRADITGLAPGLTREALAGSVDGDKGDEPEASDKAVEGATEEQRELTPKPDLDEEDPKYFAHVEPADEVVGMDIHDVFSSLELTDRGIAEFSRQNMILVQRKSEIEKKITDIGRRTALLERERSRLAKAAGVDDKAASLKAYQNAQRKARQDRAARARRFIEAGTTAEDVAKELGGKSAIDMAMSNRGRGRGRPSYPAVNPAANTLGG